jgi:hypothetical protein
MAVQSIQNRKGDIQLIAGKRTIIRVFPATGQGNADVTGISGTLSVFKGDQGIGTVIGAGTPLNGPISSRAGSMINPDKPDHSLDFEIPLNLITGESDLTVLAKLTGTGGSSASFQMTLQFQNISNTEEVQPVLIAPTGYAAPGPTMTDFQTVLNGAIKRLPVPELHYAIQFPVFWTTNRAMTSGDDFLWIDTDLAFAFFGARGFPTAIIPPPPSFPPGPMVTGMYDSFLGGEIAAFCTGTTINQATAEATFAHEFSHRYGLGHAAGCLSPSGIDPMLPQFTDMTGMDVPLHTVMPQGISELMSYCSPPRWPSSTTYNRVLSSVS